MLTRLGFVAIDWGSSRFRAYLVDITGNTLDQVQSDQGIFYCEKGAFENTLWHACKHWLNHKHKIPILMAGMIGSRDGWFETQYLPCPVSIHSLGNSIVQIPDLHSHPVYVVPGISLTSSSGLPDVIRGEETQIFGALDQSLQNNLLVCVPGTHSKWVRVKNNQITRFSTFMTGEVFSVIQQCGSISSLLGECDFNKDTFLAGVDVSQNKGGLLHHIFSIRARIVSGQKDMVPDKSYLSGMLIGAEIKSAMELYPGVTDMRIIGTDALVHDYSLAFSALGISVTSTGSEKTIVKGLWKLALVSEKVTTKMETLYVQ